jgi:enamine deaminase RidA (YjgF/YER057c/UK114 family)
MPKKEGIQVNLAAANPNLSPATRFGNLLFVAGQTGRHPVSGEVATSRLGSNLYLWCVQMKCCRGP